MEAAAWDIHLTKHDHQSFLAKYYQVFTNTNEATPPQPAATDLNPPGANSSASTPPATQHITYSETSTTLPPAATQTADGRDLFWH